MLTKKQKENFLICERYFKLTEFEMSIKNGNIELFKSYLQEIPDIDFCRLTSDNESLLNLSLKQASLKKDYTIPEIILNHKSFKVTKKHSDPIHTACLLNDFNLLKILIKSGFTLNDNINEYFTTLILKGVMKENLDHNFLDMAFYFINKYKRIDDSSLFLFYVIFLKQYIKRSKSLYSEKFFTYLNNKSEALFIQIAKKKGYNKNTTISNQGYQKNIIHYLVQEREYKLLSYILKDNPKDIYHHIKNQEHYPLFYAIKEIDISLFKWLLSKTAIKDTKNDHEILSLSYIINIMEDNNNKKIITQIYNKRNNILEEMFTCLINEGFSCHSTFRELSSAYSLLLLTQDINKNLKFRLLEKIKHSLDFNINKVDSHRETVYSLIYTNNDYNDVFAWLIKNGACINYNNISSLNKIIPRQYDYDRILSILDIDNPQEYYKINQETVYHSLIQSKHNKNNMYNLLNIFYTYGYDILSLNNNDQDCVLFSKNKGLEDNFVNCLTSFYQNEYLKKKMKEKIEHKNMTVSRI